MRTASVFTLWVILVDTSGFEPGLLRLCKRSTLELKTLIEFSMRLLCNMELYENSKQSLPVRMKGLEPPRLSARHPKCRMSTIPSQPQLFLLPNYYFEPKVPRVNRFASQVRFVLKVGLEPTRLSTYAP